MSLWLTYWDDNGVIDDILALNGRLDSLCYFGASFDSDHRSTVPEQTAEQFETFGMHAGNNLLTAVNDVIQSQGDSLLKDLDVLEDILLNDGSMEKHIGDLLAKVRGGGYSGVEIDYEGLHKRQWLPKKFVRFIEKLSEQVKKEQPYGAPPARPRKRRNVFLLRQRG